MVVHLLLVGIRSRVGQGERQERAKGQSRRDANVRQAVVGAGELLNEVAADAGLIGRDGLRGEHRDEGSENGKLHCGQGGGGMRCVGGERSGWPSCGSDGVGTKSRGLAARGQGGRA